jgi:hypothetical protein
MLIIPTDVLIAILTAIGGGGLFLTNTSAFPRKRTTSWKLEVLGGVLVIFALGYLAVLFGISFVNEALKHR